MRALFPYLGCTREYKKYTEESHELSNPIEISVSYKFSLSTFPIRI